MTPGHVNGIRCTWPEPRKPEPPAQQESVPVVEKEPRPPGRPRKEVCVRGHVNAGRISSNHTCRECSREDSRAWRARKREQRSAQQ